MAALPDKICKYFIVGQPSWQRYFGCFVIQLFKTLDRCPGWLIRESLFALKILWTNYPQNSILLLQKFCNAFAYNNKASYTTIFLKQNKKPTTTIRQTFTKQMYFFL